MSMPTGPGGEHPSTYFVQDRSDERELARLQVQDQMITTAMGGVLPEQADSTRFQRVLDVGCGTGYWLIEAAKAYPTMTGLWGVDVSARVVEYARAQAATQGVDDRVQFRTMDALRMLEFQTGYFDYQMVGSGTHTSCSPCASTCCRK
jgi:ubiquinone/menaquinone biosynthesis C-methylase UbiE